MTTNNSDPVNPNYALRITDYALNLYRAHSDFILLLILFITFRVLTLAAYRPGGLVLDFSDFYWYRANAELIRQGYYPYYNLWSQYPPLFPIVMFSIYHISTLAPPWEYANLWFSLLLGGFFLLFEIGNFVLLYLFALKIYAPKTEMLSIASSVKSDGKQAAIRTCWIYAALFVPVYTLTGHFESFPIFFFLLSVYLLLKNRPYSSAFFTGIGFMIKFIPVILFPIAFQLISKLKYGLTINNSQLSINKYPAQNAHQHSGVSFVFPVDVPRILMYLGVFIITVLVIGAPFYYLNPDLILGPIQINAIRQPWETFWALIEGNYTYGVAPIDLRDLAWDSTAVQNPTRIPWLLVTIPFALVYLWFYIRPFNWNVPRNSLAFVGFTLCLFMLWSKGYSPQWLGWPLFFIALLLPNIRGVTYAVILSVVNIVEGNFFFIIFPEDRWLFAAIIIIRTLLFIVLAAEFLWLIWPPSPRVKKIRTWGLAVFVALLIVSVFPAGFQLGRSYFGQRQQQSPYAATLNRLQNEQITGALLLNSHTTYDWFYPYLRHTYSLFMLDDYAPQGDSVETRTTNLLNNIATQTDALWIYDADAATTTPAEESLTIWLGERPPAHIQDIDGGRLYLFILK